MKKLEDFAEDINKCSKCGLCQSVCPVYKITGNDCAVSRGKFVMLDGVLKGDLKLNKNINKYLDLCLKCDKCKSFCPSAIDVCKIFETAKYEYAKTLSRKFIFFLESKYIFGNFINLFKTLSKPFRKKFSKKSPDCLKVLYFKGCVNNILPHTDNILNKLLENSNVEIIEKDFDCCGLPLLSSGNLERFEEVKQHNLKMFDCDFDYILTDCASEHIKKYVDAKLQTLQLIVMLNIKFRFKNLSL
ncbi:MAG: (Fe-S)-binding protein [Candidatus Gastranaerophilaceae bacterium]